MNEQERAIVRANLDEIANRMEELRAMPLWWAGLSETRQSEFKLFFSVVCELGFSVMLYRKAAQ